MTKEIKFNNLKELNTEYEERSYRSFVFSVGYLDRGIIENKALWQALSEKIKARKIATHQKSTATLSKNV